jgi:nucleoside-diphosphate-sugar epimerase
VKRRILVLGAGGFIGRRIVTALAATDWAAPVAAYRRSMPPAGDFERMALDATDEIALRQGLTEVDGIVNCVAGDGSSTAATRALTAAASAQARAPRLIHLSSMSVYGSATGEIDESAPLKGDLGAYSAAKVETERVIAGYPAHVILRPSCVYGPESVQWSERIAFWLLAHRVGDLGASGDGYCNLIYVDDLAQAVLQSLTASVEGQAYNVSIPEPPTWNEFFLSYARALHAVPLRRISARQLKLESRLIAPPLKVLEILRQKLRLNALRVPPPIPPSLLRLWEQEMRLVSRKAERALAMNWTPLAQGLHSTAAWFTRR